MSRVIGVFLLIALAALVVNDMAFRFDLAHLIVKREHQSAQRHWSPFYSQQYTYDDGAFKYKQDISNMQLLVSDHSLLLTDRATSYYLAAQLPVYVRNVYRHHGRTDWDSFLDTASLCYIDQAASLGKVVEFISDQEKKSELKNSPEFKYWVVNRDSDNLNLRLDCLATRGSEIAVGLENLAELVYKGEYLWLYRMN